MSTRTHRLVLGTILGLYLLLALGYGIINPLFETPDEHLHYLIVEFIADEGRLPTTADLDMRNQEAAQPPLYYALGAALIRPLSAGGTLQRLWPNPRTDTSASVGQLWLNPQADLGFLRGESRADPPINANTFIHTPAEDWPWRGYALTAHLLRMLSAVLGLGTLICIHAAGRLVWPGDSIRALLATALVAFLPQFAFINAAVSNDPLITFLSAAAVFQLLRLLGREMTIARLLLLGLTLGLAILSKAAGLLLLVYCLGVLVTFALLRGGERRWKQLGAIIGLVLVPALLIGGWLLWRNWALYGDVTAANQFIAISGGLRKYSLLQVWGDMDRVWLSLFAIMGWMNVEPPAWVYVVWHAIVLLAVVGAVFGLARAARRRGGAARPAASTDRLSGLLFHPAVILSGWFLLVAAGWLQFMLRTPADQGRLFFPALTPLALGAAYGLGQWPRPWTQLIVAAAALITSVFCLIVVIPNAYAVGPVVETLPPDVPRLDYRFDGGIELLGATVDTAVARPGEWIWTTLYWRAEPEQPAAVPLVYLELFGRGFHSAGRTVAYHGRGNYPANLWPPGEIIEDRLAARPVTWAETPVLARVGVRLEEEGESRDIGVVKIIPESWPEPETEPAALFGEGIELGAATLDRTQVRAGETVEARLRWQVTAPPGPKNLHVFLHLGDPAQAPLAQTDGPVMGGEYPAYVWEAGEVFDDSIALTVPPGLPPGEYALQLGLYDFDGGGRLPVSGPGINGPADYFPLGRLIVE